MALPLGVTLELFVDVGIDGGYGEAVTFYCVVMFVMAHL